MMLSPTRLRAAVLMVTVLSTGACAGSPAKSEPMPQTYSGSFSGQLTFTMTIAGTSRTTVCVATRLISGTMKLTLTQAMDGTVTGTGEPIGTETETAITASDFCHSTFGTAAFAWSRPVTGTPASLAFSGANTTSTGTNTVGFAGVLAGGVVSGALSVSEAFTQQNLPEPAGPGGTSNGSGTASFAVTLR